MSRIQVTRSGQGTAYAPPGHVDVTARRLHGAEVGGPSGFWVGHSVYPPGACAELGPVAGDTVYIVLDGELALRVRDGSGTSASVLYAGDSVFIPWRTIRSIMNHTQQVATLLVVVQPGEAPS
ncbi:cupin domain-containing protein [Pimelobacter simplex]|uniref:cupin domain-containing protein n=1 Tax=Nocardioides simplex TaxID=2045 RepID=UPI001932D572|nr:cupin domain-containing protein [Pimelobacter simplex]